MIKININNKFNISNDLPFVLIAGPCVIENENHSLMLAEKINSICEKLKINFIFKSSFDKANRSSIESKRGVGINEALKKGISLIISIDCGIKAIKEIKYAKSNNIDFIICDHHLPESEIPNAIAVLDPKRNDCEYPFKELCGCGIGFKLIQALCMQWKIDIQQLK